MIKTIAMTLAFCVVASAASAEMLRCKRSSISSNGFKNAEAADSWFPKSFAIRIDGDEAVSDVYGLGTVEESKGRKKITFVSASSTNVRTDVRITFIQKTSRYTAKLITTGRYAQTPGARGKCSLS